MLHRRSHHRSDDNTNDNTTVDRKGKKRHASPSPGPSNLSNDGNRLVKRVRGGVQNSESVVAVSKAVEVINVDDDDDEIQIMEGGPSNIKATQPATTSPTEALDPSEVLNHFRLKPKNVGCVPHSPKMLEMLVG